MSYQHKYVHAHDGIAAIRQALKERDGQRVFFKDAYSSTYFTLRWNEEADTAYLSARDSSGRVQARDVVQIDGETIWPRY